MRVVVNGKDHVHEGPGDLSTLLEELGAQPERVAVLVNDSVIRRAAIISTMISEGDSVEIVMLAAGGILVELIEDRAFALPPLDSLRAERLLAGLSINKLLAGVRGANPADNAAIVDATVRLSVLAADLGDHLEGLDVNPLIAHPAGCMAVDALVVPRELAADSDPGRLT